MFAVKVNRQLWVPFNEIQRIFYFGIPKMMWIWKILLVKMENTFDIFGIVMENVFSFILLSVENGAIKSDVRRKKIKFSDKNISVRL